ncbi:MAG: hypothetical protein ACYCZJ_13150 [Sulfuriferula sp.]
METTHLFEIVIGAINLLLGWLIRILWESNRDLKQADMDLADKVQKIEILVAGDYIKRHEVDAKYDALFAKLDRIEDKLSRKVDR